MSISKTTLFFLFFLFSFRSAAQSEVNLLGKWDYTPTLGVYEKVNKIIASQNGLTVAVGETKKIGEQSLNGLFLILNEDGSVRLRKQFGLAGDCSFNSIVQTMDGTFVLVGYAITASDTPKKGWILKLDKTGNQLYSNIINNSIKGDDEIIDVAINEQGIVLAVGIKNNGQAEDAWVLRINENDVVDRSIGRGKLGRVEAVIGGLDNTFVLVGSTGKSNKKNAKDAWVLKINKVGDDQWGGAKYFGGKGTQEALGITKVEKQGYVFVGTNTAGKFGDYDKWLVKINEKGEKEWQQFYGGSASDRATSVVELSAGGYAILGQTYSHLPRARNSAIDITITDAKGREIESDIYTILSAGALLSGERGDEVGHAILELPNGDIVVSGSTLPEKSNYIPRMLLSASTYKSSQLKPPVQQKNLGQLDIPKPPKIEEKPAPSNRGVVANRMLWMTPDPDEQGIKNFTTTSDHLDLKLKVLSGKALLKQNFSVLINGRKAQGQKKDASELSPAVHEWGTYRHTYFNNILLKEGMNRVQIVYADGAGNQIVSEELSFNYTNVRRPKLYVVALGVPYDNLKYTSKDALDIANLYEKLKTEPRGFKEVNITRLTSKSETQTIKIKEVFETLSNLTKRINKEDLVVVYISAHGKVNRYGEFLLMPSDYKSRAEKTYSINFENDILDGLKNLNCKKLILLDACHSGSAFDGQKNWSTGDAASSLINDLIQSQTGIEIIASSGSNEYSYEDETWGNSAFAKAIIEAFTNQKVQVEGEQIIADIFEEVDEVVKHGRDGKISIKELKLFIQKRVPYLVKTTKKNALTGQNPSNKSTELLSEDMGIYYLMGN